MSVATLLVAGWFAFVDVLVKISSIDISVWIYVACVLFGPAILMFLMRRKVVEIY